MLPIPNIMMKGKYTFSAIKARKLFEKCSDALITGFGDAGTDDLTNFIAASRT